MHCPVATLCTIFFCMSFGQLTGSTDSKSLRCGFTTSWAPLLSSPHWFEVFICVSVSVFVCVYVCASPLFARVVCFSSCFLPSPHPCKPHSIHSHFVNFCSHAFPPSQICIGLCSFGLLLIRASHFPGLPAGGCVQSCQAPLQTFALFCSTAATATPHCTLQTGSPLYSSSLLSALECHSHTGTSSSPAWTPSPASSPHGF